MAWTLGRVEKTGGVLHDASRTRVCVCVSVSGPVVIEPGRVAGDNDVVRLLRDAVLPLRQPRAFRPPLLVLLQTTTVHTPGGGGLKAKLAASQTDKPNVWLHID